MERDEVLINHMYCGDFLKQDNLGHEVINLFKSDNGNHYIYAMSAGDYAETHKDKIAAVVLVRNVNAHVAEILGIATVTEDIFGAMMPSKYKMLPGIKTLKSGFMKKNNLRASAHKKVHEDQLSYIEKEGITYGGVSLEKLYANNPIDQLGHTIYITFKVEDFRKPKKTVYLCDQTKKDEQREDCFYLKRNRMGGASVATYESLSDMKALFDKDWWEETDSCEKVDSSITIGHPPFSVPAPLPCSS